VKYKTQVKCNDCGLIYFIEDADWCIHYNTCEIGTKSCPQCHNCICHGETKDQIQARFTRNIKIGKFVKSPVDSGRQWQCKTLKKIRVGS
jgi:hypothetical protein